MHLLIIFHFNKIRLDDKMNSFQHIPLQAVIHYRHAVAVSGRGNYELALNYLNNAVTLAPQFALALCEMGYCYEKLGRYPEALVKFNTVLQSFPSHAEAHINKNRILEKMDKTRMIRS
jgi:tetratricopeptide (TPR) repeat protein